MPPFAPMAVSVNPSNFRLPVLANPWMSSSLVAGAPIQAIVVRPNTVTPVSALTPVLRRTAPLTRFLPTTRFTTWQQIISGRHSTSLRPRSGTKAPIKRSPSTPPHRPEIPHGNRRPSLKVPFSDRPLPRVPERHLATKRDAIPNPQTTRETVGAIHESPAIDVREPSSSPIRDESPRPNLETPISFTDETPVGANLVFAPSRVSARAITRIAPTNDNPATLSTIQSTPPAIDRSRLWDFKVAKVLFESQIKGPATRRTERPQNVVPYVTPLASPATVRPAAQASASHRAHTAKILEPRNESTRPQVPDTEDKDSDLAGLASISTTLQELRDTQLGPWMRQLLSYPQGTNNVSLPSPVREAFQLSATLRQSESPYSVLKGELARIDGELRIAPLPHILPNMGEIDREALLGVLNHAGAHEQNPEPTQTGRWDPELVKQVRHEIAMAGYLDEKAGHIRKLNNAEDGKAFLHFLTHLARKRFAAYGLDLIDIVNLVNETIGYGPFLKQKDINGTIRSMDPKRWGKDSEVLLHPLMGRANLVINVLDLIENNRITMPEVLDLLRIGTDGDILERLAVELAAAQIYRNDSEWWQELWNGQDAQALIPWFDDLLTQIRGALTDIKDVLTFVGSLETTPAKALA